MYELETTQADVWRRISALLSVKARKLVDVSDRDWHKEPPDYYKFIPYGEEQALGEIKLTACYLHLTRNERHIDLKFLDVGCGYGNIMAIADACGLKPTGIEVDKKVLACALYDIYKPRTQAKNPSLSHKIVQVDAFDFKHYRLFDIVYMYCPIRNVKLERKLEQLIEDKLKVGAIYICNHKMDDRIRKDKRFKEILPGSRPVWEKINK